MRKEWCTYICPLRLAEVKPHLVSEFSRYWKFLEEQGCEVLVVDGSPRKVFDNHAKAWKHCRHIRVDPRYKYLNGKVNGIFTGLDQANHENIILADDDIRYSTSDLNRMSEELERYEVVRPQNYFSPLPWWTYIDSARILLNRAVFSQGDFPGTFGFHKSVFYRSGAFDGDVLFDNEELVKHMENQGAHILFAHDFFVLRKPPSFEKWLEQRPRQAYEDFVMKKRTAFFLLFLPSYLALLKSGRTRIAHALAATVFLAAIYKAKQGRENGAEKCIPTSAVLAAPAWVLERSVSTYLALYWRISKGGYPFGDRIIKKGTGSAWKESRKK